MADSRTPPGPDFDSGAAVPDFGSPGLRTGSTPPESGGTSDVSEHEPDTRNRFPVSGAATIVVVGVIVVVFLVVAVGLILMAFGVW